MGDLQAHLLTPPLSVQQFWIKNGKTSVSPAPIHLISPQGPFCLFSCMKKVLKENWFADVEEVKKKMSEALQCIKIDGFKNCFEQWENILIGVMSNGEYLECD